MIATKDIAWLAGLLEGEGSFQLTKDCQEIRLGMTDRDIVDRVHKATRCHSEDLDDTP